MTVIRTHNGMPVRIERSNYAGGHTYVGNDKVGFHVPTDALLAIVNLIKEQDARDTTPVPQKPGKHRK